MVVMVVVMVVVVVGGLVVILIHIRLEDANLRTVLWSILRIVRLNNVSL
jgi:hypothetical protein